MSKRPLNERNSSIEELKRTIQTYLKENDNLMVLVNLTRCNEGSENYDAQIATIAQKIWDVYNSARVNKTDSPTFITWVNNNIRNAAFNEDIQLLKNLKLCFTNLQESGPIGNISERTDEILRKLLEQINKLEEPPLKTPRTSRTSGTSGGLRRKTKKKTNKKTNKKRKTKRRKTRRLKLKNN
jgi:hypothetical protein